jgi:hypothetical protein
LIFTGNHLPKRQHKVLTEEEVHGIVARLEILCMPAQEIGASG